MLAPVAQTTSCNEGVQTLPDSLILEMKTPMMSKAGSWCLLAQGIAPVLTAHVQIQKRGSVLTRDERLGFVSNVACESCRNISEVNDSSETLTASGQKTCHL